MSDLVDLFRGIDDAELRVLATFESLNYTIEFLREDLEGKYSEGDLDRAYQNMVANQVSADDFKKVVNIGDLDCQVFLFEETIAFLFPSARYEGLFASFEREKPFPLLEVVEAALTTSQLSGDPSDGTA